MGMNVQARSGKHQLRVTHRLLSKPYFHTFDDETEAHNAGQTLLAMLARGVVPAELLAPAKDSPRRADPLLTQVISDYETLAPLTESDADLLPVIRNEVAAVRVSGLTFAWVEAYVAGLKTAGVHLAPSSVRKRVGAMSRVFQWHANRSTPHGEQAPVNPFKLLPDGYSLYTKAEAEALAGEGLAAKRDQQRDRRFARGDQAAIEEALAGVKREDRERALSSDLEFTLLFALIVDTGPAYAAALLA